MDSTHDNPRSFPEDEGDAAASPSPSLDPATYLLDKQIILTERERKLFDYLMAGRDPKDALALAGYAKSNFALPFGFRQKIPHLMELRGFSDQKLLDKLEFLFNAKEVKVFNGYQGGPLQYSEPLPALDVQLRTFDLATKLKGWERTTEALPAQIEDNSITVQVVHIGGQS